MKFILTTALLLSFSVSTLAQTAQSQTEQKKQYQVLTYKVHDDGEARPFEVVLEVSKDFTEVRRLIVKEIAKNIILFDIKAAKLKLFIEDEDVLKIEDTDENLKPRNKEVYNNYYGDAPIERKSTYAVFVELYIDENGQRSFGKIDIAHNEHQEMALWG